MFYQNFNASYYENGFLTRTGRAYSLSPRSNINSKENISVMVETNMYGTQKSKPLVIGKSKMSSYFSWKNGIPVIYKSSKPG